jgi:hypothetical protein
MKINVPGCRVAVRSAAGLAIHQGPSASADQPAVRPADWPTQTFVRMRPDDIFRM